jgi:hypothetical protein
MIDPRTWVERRGMAVPGGDEMQARALTGSFGTRIGHRL